jgi:ArsR family transcriptional regulator
MSAPGPKHALFEQFAIVAKGLAHAHRLELLEQLAQGERSVEALAEKLGLPIANASQHLQQLRRAGIVNSRRAGKFVYYALANDAVIDLISALRRIAEQNNAQAQRVIRTYFDSRDSLEAVSKEQLLKKLRRDEVMVVDVRPADEFALGHLPGAINIPLRQLKSRLSEIDAKAQIVAYCRGPYCILSYEAVELLRKRGFDARRLEDGLPEWKASGLPVALGTQ